MKVGVMYGNLKAIFENKGLEFCRNIGLSGIQLSVTHGKYNATNYSPENFDKLDKKLESYGLEISAYCGDLGSHGFMVEKDNPEKIAKTKKMIDVAAERGVAVISTHIGVIPANKDLPTYKALQNAMREVGEYAKQKNVTVAIETGPEKAEVLKDFIDSLNGGIGVNLDPANFTMVARQDAVEAVYLLGKYIVHTHAKDGKNLQPVDPGFVYGFVDPIPADIKKPSPGPIYKEMPIGQGDVDWDRYLKALQEIGYNGYLTIEREAIKDVRSDVKGGAEFLLKKLGKEKLNKPVTLAVIGCGSIANAAHLPALKSIPGVRLKYVVDLVKERADAAKAKYGAEISKTDYHEILSDSELEGVIICTHTDFHTIIAIDCLNAGINVLTEKPVSMNYADALRMKEAQEKSGKILNVAVCMRYNSAVNAIKSIIDKGELGNIYQIYCSFRASRSIPGIGGDFTTKAKSGGGVLIDWGVHYLDLILYILNQPNILTVTGDCHSVIGKDISSYHAKSSWGISRDPNEKGIYDVEDFVSGHVRTDGAVISFNGAWAQNIAKNDTYIDFLGDKGGIRYYYGKGYTRFGEVKDKLRGKSAVVIGRNHYREEDVRFVSEIRNPGACVRNCIDNILPTAKLLDAIYQSDAKKKEVDF